MISKFLKTALPLALILTMVACSPDTDAVDTVALSQSKTALAQKYDYSSEELELAQAINDHRESLGLNALQIQNYVSFKSEEHNAYMIANNVVNHDQFDIRSHEIIEALGATKVNENVAYNYVTPNSVMHAWLESPGHKANIEGDFTDFGISIRINPETGKKYYTNIFIKK